MNKPIICFEGPSGIGKTTLSKLFSDFCNIIPEVNQLYNRTDNESKYWYYERQVERYNLCKSSNKISILDGDIFQPIWYNWACNYPSEFLTKKEIHDFYKTKLSEQSIAFPDLYIIFQVEEKELWLRKEKDKTRQRRNFEKHLNIIGPLNEYYQFLDQETNIEMKFIEYTDIEAAKREVLSFLEYLRNKNIDDLKTFEQIENWINRRS